MNCVGELVLARNQILQFSSTLSDPTLLSTAQRLNLITTELQEGVMKTRMQPIRNIWDKFPRVVRDLAMECGKQVQIAMEGEETELDRTIIEAIKDPLTHLIRNAVDHGIESPQVRRVNGKPAAGRLLLRAFHEGGQVNIEISDDGAGLNLERIAQKAIDKELVSTEQAARMSDREIAQLVFAPGFSTATEVSNVSGRGVGMDVVKTNIEKVGGTVDIQSQVGQGTTIKIKIPLTLAIIPALIVTCGGDPYAIPQPSLLELVRLEGEQARKGIERLHDVSVYRLRGRLLPIVWLRKEFELGQQSTECANAPRDEIVNIVVLQAGERQFGLVVDSICDTEEIVVKPLGKQLKGIPVYAGATIMGDGKVALILDVLGIAQRAHVVSEVCNRPLAEHAADGGEHVDGRQTLLIVAIGDRRLALDISLVSRLEEIPHSQIEKAADHDVVQYRGQIMPLLNVGRLLGISTAEEELRPLQVVVHSNGDRSVGLVVDRIIDIVETAIETTRATRNNDLLATAVVQQRVTDLVDVASLVRRADPTFYQSSPEEAIVA
jgi:two-component system, chemotaxis family, sensor kinase CheA